MKNYPGSTGYAGRNAAKNYASTNDARNYACSGAAEPGSYGSNEAGNAAPLNDPNASAFNAGPTGSIDSDGTYLLKLLALIRLVLVVFMLLLEYTLFSWE